MPSDPHEAMPNAVTLEARTLLTVREFEKCVRPGGTPVVLRGWMANWQALDKWDYEFFKVNYGSDSISITWSASDNETMIETSLAEYIHYVLNPDDVSSPLKQLELRLNLGRPLYCFSYKPFRAHPELWNDISIPPFVADWWPFFSAAFAQAHFPKDQGWLLIGSRGVVAELHKDSHHTLAWLAQIRGRKACYLFSPDDSEALYWGRVDPANPDLDRFPGFREATPYLCVLNPGEMLFLPPDWWHHVVALDNSITVSCNFVNHLNFGYYLRTAFGKQLPGILAGLPAEVPPVQRESDDTGQ